MGSTTKEADKTKEQGDAAEVEEATKRPGEKRCRSQGARPGGRGGFARQREREVYGLVDFFEFSKFLIEVHVCVRLDFGKSSINFIAAVDTQNAYGLPKMRILQMPSIQVNMITKFRRTD